MKTFREIAEMHYISEPINEIDKQYRERRINALEKLLTEQLGQHFVSRCNADSDKLTECSNCGDRVQMISLGEFCPHCLC